MTNNDYIKKSIINFYTKVLLKHGIYSVDEVERAIEDGRINMNDFLLDLDKIIPPQKQQEILEQNPDSVEIGNRKAKVEYDYDSETKEFSAKVNLLLKELSEITHLPSLPSGRTITFEVSRNESGPILFSGNSLEELKQKSETI